MTQQAHALYHLQTIDLAIASHRRRLDEITEQLADQKAILAARQQIEAADKSLAPWKRRLQDLELEVKSLNTKASNAEARLYSGTVTNPKELQDIQEEIASLKRRRTSMEDQVLEAMIEVESGEESCAEARSQLSEAEASWQAQQADLLQERETRQAELADLDVRRQAALPDVTDQSLKIYKQLARQKHGHAVSPLEGSTCKICGMGQNATSIQQVRQGDALVYCGGCERILVLL